MNLGYACLNTELRKSNIFCSRTCRLKTIEEKGMNHLYSLTEKNLDDLLKMLKWNKDNGIHLFRMSSDMFPFATHKDYYQKYDLEQFKEKLKKIGEIAKEYSQRLSFHPCQFIQINSEKPHVVENSIRDLDFASNIMDLMGLDQNSVIVVHGGPKSGGKKKCLQRLAENFKKLSESCQKRLVLENCELCYTIEDLLELNICPVVVDFHHHNLNQGNVDTDEKLLEIIQKVKKTWDEKQIKIKFHISESREGITEKDTLAKRRAHSDYITFIPEILNMIDFEFDLMIEAKMKEQALFKMKDL